MRRLQALGRPRPRQQAGAVGGGQGAVPRHPRAVGHGFHGGSARARPLRCVGVDTTVLDVDTSRDITVDLTDAVRSFCAGRGDGLCNVCPARHRWRRHHRDRCPLRRRPGRRADAPPDDRYRHAHGSPGHGADHVLPAIVVSLGGAAVSDGKLPWACGQSVVLVDLNRDNPRRTVRLSFVAG